RAPQPRGGRARGGGGGGARRSLRSTPGRSTSSPRRSPPARRRRRDRPARRNPGTGAESGALAFGGGVSEPDLQRPGLAGGDKRRGAPRAAGLAVPAHRDPITGPPPTL